MRLRYEEGVWWIVAAGGSRRRVEIEGVENLPEAGYPADLGDRWYPIEMAPYGEEVLVYCPLYAQLTKRSGQFVASRLREGARWRGISIDGAVPLEPNFPPSHFMRLPPGPEKPENPLATPN